MKMMRLIMSCVLAGSGLCTGAAALARMPTNHAPPGKTVHLWISEPAESPPASLPSANQAKLEQDSYNSDWRRRLGDPPTAHAAEFMHEIYGGGHAEDRDSRAAHFQKALLLRPDDPTNIAIEFRLAGMLGQNVDPAHHQTTRPEEAQAISEHIVAHYDHKAYYLDEAQGESESLEYMVPRAAIWASSYASAVAHDQAKARKYAGVALDDFYWTIQKRRAAWADAPQPSTQVSPFDRPGSGDAQLRRWQQRKADATAGNVMGPYAKAFSDAAVGVYARAYAEGPGDVGRVLRHLMAQYPDSPLAAAAQARLAKLPPGSQSLPVAAVPSTPPATLAAAPVAPPVAPEVIKSQPISFLIPLTITGVLGALLLAWLFLRKPTP